MFRVKRHYSKITNVYNDINLLSKKPQTSTNLNGLIEFGNINKKKNIVYASQYMYNELPIRFAHKIKDLDSLPYDLYNNLYINTIRDWYITSFHDIRNLKYPTDFNDSLEMVSTIENIYNRHSPTLITMANGIQSIKNEKIDINENEIQTFLNKFYMSRIGIRVLLSHYSMIFKKTNTYEYGIINTKCSPSIIIKDVITDINSMCENSNIEPIEININHNTITFPYISSHLYYILFEVLKNSVKATHDFNKTKLPPINIEILNDNNWIIIKVSDLGGGISPISYDKIWNYFYTTAENPINIIDNDFSIKTPLSGFGYGLPVTKLYLKYFGGHINICSNYNYGTDTYILLKINGDFNEPLL